MTHVKKLDERLLIGRAEWFALPDLGVPVIKAKIDTGAKTSALHAFNIKNKVNDNIEMVSFDIHPIQQNRDIIVHCQAEVVDKRNIMSSNGSNELRYVIKTEIVIAGQSWTIELTLSNRDPLKYRMLIGREALKNRVLINPDLFCNQEKFSNDQIISFYSD